jgi:LmbE family N-acetylglucosaminyl deacetylase
LPIIEPDDKVISLAATVLTFALTGAEPGGMVATLGVNGRVNTCELEGVLTLDADDLFV